ncbi:DUF421 domain-containing protein [Rubeoparvulum massiliense]|uniref:DUF421 domain-containing protein n=1 Tax=Rubeoparvulum massiliense TaxID=1631346 RepID=UPI00065DE867|nr:DUF421 domain-containing protein [Rubeoparvulum massiliense]
MSYSMLILLRSIFAFVIILILTRISGKQQVAEMTMFEYIVGITIGSIAASLSVDLDLETLSGTTSLLVWGVLPILIAIGTLKSKKARSLVNGTARILIQNGEIDRKALKKERMNLDELMMALRLKNIFQVADVELAVMEINGELSVLPKSDKRPLQPSDMQIKPPPSAMPINVIQDGVVQDQDLKRAGLSLDWLKKQLADAKVESAEDVILAQAVNQQVQIVGKESSAPSDFMDALQSMNRQIEQLLNNSTSDDQNKLLNQVQQTLHQQIERFQQLKIIPKRKEET